MTQALYHRVLLKISGEALMGSREFGMDPETINRVARDIAEVHAMKVDVCLVVGGGNIYRGISGASAGMDRANADYMGMLATIINALALQNALEKLNLATRVQSAIPMSMICESYVRRRAIRHMEKRRVVIFAAGTGNPYFTTDTAAALRASEMGCDALFKGTKVDGIYTADPKHHKHAERFDRLHYRDVYTKDLGVMDTAAVALCRENAIPIVVFSIQTPGAFAQVVRGHGNHTIVSNHPLKIAGQHDTPTS